MWKKKIGKYKIIKPLEERDKKGAFGDVYLVEYNDKQFALKQLRSSGVIDDEILTKFVKEMLRIAQLKEKYHLEFLTDIFDHDLKKHYFVMEYLPESARDYFGKTGDRDFIARLIHITRELHNANVVHRDLKPDNIRVRNGKPIFIDFGLSSWWDSHSAIGWMGTPFYAPPEISYMLRPEYYEANEAREANRQLVEIEVGNLDKRIKKVKKIHDVYSLGITIGELFTGDLPFRTDSEYKEYLDKGHSKLLDDWLKGIPGTYKEFVNQAVTFYPKNRPLLDHLIQRFKIRNPGITGHIVTGEEPPVTREGKYECLTCGTRNADPADFCPVCRELYSKITLNMITPGCVKSEKIPASLELEPIDKEDKSKISIIVDVGGNDFNVVLGRKEKNTDIYFPDDHFMSNPHGRLIKKGKHLYYRDDKNGEIPKNPGRINNIPVGKSKAELLSGDFLLIGSTAFKIQKCFGRMTGGEAR
jgi:serine/threonine protein kinase